MNLKPLKTGKRWGQQAKPFSIILSNQRGRISLSLLFLFSLVAFYAVILFAPGLLMPHVGKFLNNSQQSTHADAIVVLLGASTPDRVLDAYTLFKNGGAPKIVFGSGFEDQELSSNQPQGFLWPKPSTHYILGFESLGVPEENIEIVDTSWAYDTSSELEAIGKYGRSQGWKEVNLVTSITHTKRVSLIWKRLNPDIVGVTVASDAPGYDKWWKHGKWKRRVGYEYAALVKESWAQLMHSLGKMIGNN